MTGFGKALRTEREQSGVSLEAIAHQTKISLRHLEAVEAEEFSALPGGVFRRGIVKAYVETLRLDTAAWMERFQASSAAQSAPEAEPADNWAAFAENVRRNRTPSGSGSGMRWLGVVAMLGTLVAAGWAGWHFVLRGHIL